MEFVLSLDHLRIKIFNHLMIKDLMNLEQVSDAAHDALPNYRCKKPLRFSIENFLVSEIQKKDIFDSNTTDNSDHLEFSTAVQIIQRGPVLTNACISFDLNNFLESIEANRRGFKRKEISLLASLMTKLSAEVQTFCIDLDLKDYRIANQDLLQRLGLVPPLLRVFQTFATHSFNRCAKLNLKINHDNHGWYNGPDGWIELEPMVRYLLIGLDTSSGDSGSGFLPKFPNLQTLTLAGSHMPPLPEAFGSSLRNIQELTLIPQSVYEDVAAKEGSEIPNRQPAILDLSSLRRLTIHPQDIECFLSSYSNTFKSWDTAFNNTTGINLLASLRTSTSSLPPAPPRPLALQHLTLTLHELNRDWTEKLMEIMLTDPLTCPALETIDFHLYTYDNYYDWFNNIVLLIDFVDCCILSQYTGWSLSDESVRDWFYDGRLTTLANDIFFGRKNNGPAENEPAEEISADSLSDVEKPAMPMPPEMIQIKRQAN